MTYRYYVKYVDEGEDKWLHIPQFEVKSFWKQESGLQPVGVGVNSFLDVLEAGAVVTLKGHEFKCEVK